MSELVINKKYLNRKLAKLAIPIAIQGVVSATLGMVDNLMVGFLGETELAAVGVGSQIYTIHFMLLFGLIGGSATFMAQFYGAGDRENIRKVVGLDSTILFGVAIVFFLGVHLTMDSILGFYTQDPAVKEMATSYVRICSVNFFLLAFSAPMEMAFKASQQTRVPMITSSVVFTTNTLLNFILIFGKFGAPKLGVAGAAIATVVARFLDVVLIMSFAWGKNNFFKGTIKSYFGWPKDLVKRLMINAAPTTVNELMWSLGQSMYVAAFNRIGTTEYAAFQAANTISNIFSFAGFSVGDATLIMVGEKLGEGKKEETWEISKHLLKIGTTIAIILGGFLMAVSWPLAHLFKLTPLGQLYTFKVLLVIGAFLPLHLHNGIHVTGTLRGGGDTKFAMLAEIFCVWFVAVPLAFISAMVWKVPIHWAVAIVRMEEVTKFFILTKRYLSKKWMNVMIKGL